MQEPGTGVAQRGKIVVSGHTAILRHLCVVPGDRTISWPKLRSLLGVSRLSMPDAEVAKHATGYERGTITPFGSATAWPVIADERLRGRQITLGAGQPGLAVAVAADEVLLALDAIVADVSDLEPAPSTRR